MKLHNMFKKTVGKEHGTSKNTKVRNNLIRLGSVEEELLDQIMEPIAGMEDACRTADRDDRRSRNF